MFGLEMDSSIVVKSLECILLGLFTLALPSSACSLKPTQMRGDQSELKIIVLNDEQYIILLNSSWY